MQGMLGEIIENDLWDHPVFEYEHKNLSYLDGKLYNAIQKHRPISLTDLYLKTKDREVIAYAMQISNEYKHNQLQEK